MASELRDDALSSLVRAVDRSKRHDSVPFAVSFIRAKGDKAPLASLIYAGGGRGGEVRLKLYLCITMMATQAPHDLKTPPTPKAWARLLALPQTTGPRRVNSNLKWLESNGFIAFEPRVGAPAKIVLLSVGGAGEPYVRPSLTSRYVSMPLGLWSHGWLIDLSATAIALLLVLMELQGGREGARYVPSDRRAEYGLSPGTWTRGRKELEACGLLTVRRTPQGGDFVYNRMRNLYRVDEDRLNSPSPGLPGDRRS